MASSRNRLTAVQRVTAGAICALLLVLVSGCTSARRHEDAPRPRSTTLLNTIEASNVGTRIIITAGVSAVLTRQSFVVRDADLPGQGLLILGDGAAGLEPPSLVTVYGVIDRFSYSHFVTTYDLGPEPVYERYEGRKFLVAADITTRA
ncbi:hypothetical protein [Nucisporomicrobium flavum]|uniref:hypothetical protein n=1 Tax=Nucisporomicrobium flavum TaxID=2785915 RepID=UPI0018F5B7F3|nr:hypothetical protein [Nucisporomicrobium flavum]